MAKVQRIKKVELWSMWRIIGVAFIAALIAVVLMFAFAMTASAKGRQQRGGSSKRPGQSLRKCPTDL